MPKAESETGGADDKTPATKQAVYDTAVRLFARNGFAATGMRELSREAGVNLATVNYFYGSKKGLLKAILNDYFTGVIAVLTENLAGDDSPDVKLRRNIAGVVRYFDANTDKMIIALTELAHDDPDIIEFKAQSFKRAMSIIFVGLGNATDRVPVPVIGPAMVALAASRYLFMPVMEKALPPGCQELSAENYPDIIAELFVNGFNGLMAANPGDKND